MIGAWADCDVCKQHLGVINNVNARLGDIIRSFRDWLHASSNNMPQVWNAQPLDFGTLPSFLWAVSQEVLKSKDLGRSSGGKRPSSAEGVNLSIR
jgi:hypothetical protein